MVCNWGLVLVVQADNTLVCLKEKELNSKLELLYNKSLYLLALNLAQSHQVHFCATTPYRCSTLPVQILNSNKNTDNNNFCRTDEVTNKG